MPLAGLVAEAIAELRRKATQERGSDGRVWCDAGASSHGVSPKLAALIQAVDAAMIEEFGSGRFAYSMVTGDGIVAARNPPDDFVPPIVALATPPTPPADS